LLLFRQNCLSHNDSTLHSHRKYSQHAEPCLRTVLIALFFFARCASPHRLSAAVVSNIIPYWLQGYPVDSLSNRCRIALLVGLKSFHGITAMSKCCHALTAHQTSPPYFPSSLSFTCVFSLKSGSGSSIFPSKTKIPLHKPASSFLPNNVHTRTAFWLLFQGGTSNVFRAIYSVCCHNDYQKAIAQQ
jgi:hypothetical protein